MGIHVVSDVHFCDRFCLAQSKLENLRLNRVSIFVQGEHEQLPLKTLHFCLKFYI